MSIPTAVGSLYIYIHPIRQQDPARTACTTGHARDSPPTHVQTIDTRHRTLSPSMHIFTSSSCWGAGGSPAPASVMYSTFGLHDEGDSRVVRGRCSLHGGQVAPSNSGRRVPFHREVFRRPRECDTRIITSFATKNDWWYMIVVTPCDTSGFVLFDPWPAWALAKSDAK